jgi:hypothetical protein
MNYDLSLKLDFSYEDVVIKIKEAKTEGSATWAHDTEAGTSSKSVENKSGATGWLAQNGEKLLILDGLNGDVKSSYSMAQEKFTQNYEFSIQGFFGSDETGMFKIETPERVKGTSQYKCPSEGKITILDADGNKLTIVSDGKQMTVTDGNETEEYPCN